MRHERDGRVTFEGESDLPPVAMSMAGTAWNRTGSWKYMEPYYRDLTAPCADRCLVDNEIVTVMRWTEAGRYDEAARTLLATNPFPAVTGRVCPAPCEKPCNRKAMGGAVSIRAIERFLGDFAVRQGILPEQGPEKGKRVAVVGAGPAGLAAACFLRRRGIAVVVHEGRAEPGGLLRYGIPPYRLPRRVVEREIERLHDRGILFRTGSRLGGDTDLASLCREYDAVVLAFGHNATRMLGIPGEEVHGVWDGIGLLADSGGAEPLLGGEVVVLGGGNTAIDCARTVLRMGRSVRILYRRSEREMPAFREEIDAAREEGIGIDCHVAPVSIARREDGRLDLRCIRTEPGERDASGRRRPVPVAGSEYSLPVDTVVKATGETIDRGILPEVYRSASGPIARDAGRHTAWRGVYVCGDCAGDGGTVGEAIRAGREAAASVVADLLGLPEDSRTDAEKPELARFKRFNTAYFREVSPPALPRISVDGRRGGFEEIVRDLPAEGVRAEATRCFKCGTCVRCDNCLVFCPDTAIARTADGYAIDADHCKGCGVCVTECPRGAIHLRRGT